MDDFIPIAINHKSVFETFLSQDSPRISELTFTNLFMWRFTYRPSWISRNGCLLIIMQPEHGDTFGFPPIGQGDKVDALEYLMQRLGALSSMPRVCRAPQDFIASFVDIDRYDVQEDPANHDYVYLAKDLIDLPGNRFHRKKNHLNQFVKNHEFEYRPLDLDLVQCFLRMQEDWCELRNCAEEPGLMEEDRAVYEAMINFEELSFTGGAIMVNSRVEAFSLGEPLNPDTAVIHIEKANPAFPGLYATINHHFCQHAWSHMKYINREQDLGIEGLRRAKQSYQPHHMVKKYIVAARD